MLLLFFLFQEEDNYFKIWISRNYLALGEKDKAKAILSKVLLSDRKNKEVEELLKVI
jgi:GH15 family glucan-1,4-alpha-glucosidase